MAVISYRPRSASRRMAVLLVFSFGLGACGEQNQGSPATTATSAIRWGQTVAPPGVDVPGARWLKIEGAGGKSTNVQVAAVLRPTGTDVVPLVVWLHDGGGASAWDISAAMQLASAGFIVLVGCWDFASGDPVVFRGISVPRVPCPENLAPVDDAISALVEVGRQQSGVKRGSIGLVGVSAGGPRALRHGDINPEIGAVAVDSSAAGPSKVRVPVLMLGGTADSLAPVRVQQEYEQDLRRSGTTVDAHYYEGGLHGLTTGGDFQADAIMRIVALYRRYLN